jgi:hypothetical protein
MAANASSSSTYRNDWGSLKNEFSDSSIFGKPQIALSRDSKTETDFSITDERTLDGVWKDSSGNDRSDGTQAILLSLKTTGVSGVDPSVSKVFVSTKDTGDGQTPISVALRTEPRTVYFNNALLQAQSPEGGLMGSASFPEWPLWDSETESKQVGIATLVLDVQAFWPRRETIDGEPTTETDEQYGHDVAW